MARSAYREAVAAFEQALEVVLHLRRATNRVHRPLICAWRCAMRSTLWESSGGFSSPCRKPKLLPKPWRPTSVGVGLRLSTCPICGGMRTGPRPRDWPSRPDYCHCPGDTGLTTTAQYYLGIGYYSMGDRRAESASKRISCVSTARCSMNTSVCPGWPPCSPAVSLSSPSPSAVPSPWVRYPRRKECR